MMGLLFVGLVGSATAQGVTCSCACPSCCTDSDVVSSLCEALEMQASTTPSSNDNALVVVSAVFAACIVIAAAIAFRYRLKAKQVSRTQRRLDTLRNPPRVNVDASVAPRLLEQTGHGEGSDDAGNGGSGPRKRNKKRSKRRKGRKSRRQSSGSKAQPARRQAPEEDAPPPQASEAPKSEPSPVTAARQRLQASLQPSVQVARRPSVSPLPPSPVRVPPAPKSARGRSVAQGRRPVRVETPPMPRSPPPPKERVVAPQPYKRAMDGIRVTWREDLEDVQLFDKLHPVSPGAVGPPSPSRAPSPPILKHSPPPSPVDRQPSPGLPTEPNSPLPDTPSPSHDDHPRDAAQSVSHDLASVHLQGHPPMLSASMY